MPLFQVDVEGQLYEVDAENEQQAWEKAYTESITTPNVEVTAPRPTQEEIDAFNAEPSTLEKIGDMFTGSLRQTPETETLPEWTGMPELNQLSIASAKTGLGTLTASPDEIVQIIQANFPQTQIRQDAKGNYVIKSSIDAKDYVIPAGFSMGDIPRAAAGILEFTPAGRAKSIAGSVLGNAATQGAIEASQSETGGQFNVGAVGLAGLIGGAIPAAAQLRNASLAKPQVVQDIERFNITPMTSDIVAPQGLAAKTVQNVGEVIPYAGTGGVRATQQTQRQNAVQGLLDEFGVSGAVNYQDETIKSLLAKRGADLERYSTMKTEIIERLAPSGVVPVNNATKAIDDQLAKLSKDAGTKQVDMVIQDLKDFKQSIQGKDLNSIELQRRLLGDRYAPAELANVRDLAEKTFSKVYAPLRSDMGNFIKKTGQPADYTKWMVANKKLAGLSDELNNSALKTVLRKGEDTPEVVKRLLFSQTPSDVKSLYRNLPRDGKVNAQLALLQKAGDEAVETAADGTVKLNPEKFRTFVNKYSNNFGIFFNPADKAKIDGLMRALQYTQRAPKANQLNEQTGAKLFPPVIFGGIGLTAGEPVAAISAGIGIGALARLYESAPVRNLLISLSKAPKGSPKEAQLVQQLTLATQNIQE